MLSMRKYVLWIGALALPVLATASCSSAGNDENSATSGDDAITITQQPHKSLCADAPKGFARCFAQVRTDSTGQIKAFATPSGFGPSDLVSAYKLPSTGGTGATIAIVDAQDNPKAESDLAVYRSQYGLPACTTANGCFKKVNQNGQASPLPTADKGWAGEISLDLQMASAICPSCKILLVEANTASMDDLGAAVNRAATMGATVISNSYGGGEDGSEATSDSSFFNHPGIAIFASSGDNGFGVSYPASSAHVVGVGGTSLKKASNTRGWTETVWNGAGSGCSSSVAKPSFQKDTGCSKRTVADVSAIADPNTGVAVYDSYGGSGWAVYGGTSVASPVVASIYALLGLGNTDNSYAYSHTAGFFDVTSGSNGSCGGSYLCTGTTGFDGPTGLGTPNGAVLANGGGGGGGGDAGTDSGNDSGTDSGGGGGGTCSHSECTSGAKLTNGCDPCVTKICAQDSFCCNTNWDSQCVSEATSICGASTCSDGGGGGGGGGGTCTHSECSTGVKLVKTCNACVTKICNADSYCCSTKWDAICAGEAKSICGETCN